MIYRESLIMSSTSKSNENAGQLNISADSSFNRENGYSGFNREKENQIIRSNEPSIIIKVFNEYLSGQNTNGKLDIFPEELKNLRGRDLAEAMFLSGNK